MSEPIDNTVTPTPGPIIKIGFTIATCNQSRLKPAAKLMQKEIKLVFIWPKNEANY